MNVAGSILPSTCLAPKQILKTHYCIDPNEQKLRVSGAAAEVGRDGMLCESGHIWSRYPRQPTATLTGMKLALM